MTLWIVAHQALLSMGILQARILEWFPMPSSIFPTQALNPGLPHCRQILYHLSHQGSLNMWWVFIIIYWLIEYLVDWLKFVHMAVSFKGTLSFCHCVSSHDPTSLCTFWKTILHLIYENNCWSDKHPLIWINKAHLNQVYNSLIWNAFRQVFLSFEAFTIPYQILLFG